MTWIVDTCVLLDVHLNDAAFGRTSAACLAHLLPQGLAITSTTFIELGPAFRGNLALAEVFLDEVGVAHQALPGSVQGLTPAWSEDDTTYAFGAWHRQTQARRASGGVIPRRPVADLFIATVARRFAGVVTRNGAHFQAFDSGKALRIVDPTQQGTWP
jgi:predicted nucleic acid-binding protein